MWLVFSFTFHKVFNLNAVFKITTFCTLRRGRSCTVLFDVLFGELFDGSFDELFNCSFDDLFDSSVDDLFDSSVDDLFDGSVESFFELFGRKSWLLFR